MHRATAELIAAAERELARRARVMNAEFDKDPDFLARGVPADCAAMRAMNAHADLEGWLYVAKTRGETRHPLSAVMQVELAQERQP